MLALSIALCLGFLIPVLVVIPLMVGQLAAAIAAPANRCDIAANHSLSARPNAQPRHRGETATATCSDRAFRRASRSAPTNRRLVRRPIVG